MLPAARILRSDGTDGAVLAGLLGIELDQIDTKEPVFIVFDGLPVPFFILEARPKGTGKAILRLNDVNCLKDSEELVGKEILLDCEEECEDGEDFTGWKVFDGERLLGDVDYMELIPGNPCLCIGSLMIPVHEDLIVSADPERRELVLDLPEGLTEL
ncbi:MAG: hypothetical protein MJY42_04515 [Bacteroidales bacterium]|nr:hypothetical protein [Bacteroidales bacterium]